MSRSRQRTVVLRHAAELGGHELLDGIRLDATWQRVQALAREKGLELSFEVIVHAVRAPVEGGGL